MSETENQTQPATSPTGRPGEDRSARIAVTVFPVIIIVAFLIGFLVPEQTAPLGNFTSVALGIMMFAMGVTLTIPDFALVVKRPLPVLLGVVAQYVIMPAIALGLVWAFQLPPELAIGVLLVGCAPGGTSSNVITYLAKGDVTLSVTMTSVSTLLAPIFTPLLTFWLAGSLLPVDAGAMAMSIVQMVLSPVVAGLLVRWLLRQWIDSVLPLLPWISVLGISYVVVAVVAGSAHRIIQAGLLVLLVMILHNGLGYLLGTLLHGYSGTPSASRGPPQSRLACRTPALQQHWPQHTSTRLRPCPPRSSVCGTTFQVAYSQSSSATAPHGKTKANSPNQPSLNSELSFDSNPAASHQT